MEQDAHQNGKLLVWAVVANISDHLRGGTEPGRFYQGTKMFSPSSKVYVGRAYWGMGAVQIHVTGLRRTSRKRVDSVVETAVLRNFRVMGVYSPLAARFFERHGDVGFASREDAESYLDRIEQARNRDLPEKLLPITCNGPWGEWHEETYRIECRRSFLLGW